MLMVEKKQQIFAKLLKVYRTNKSIRVSFEFKSNFFKNWNRATSKFRQKRGVHIFSWNKLDFAKNNFWKLWDILLVDHASIRLDIFMSLCYQFNMLFCILSMLFFYRFTVSNIEEISCSKLPISLLGNIFSWYLIHLKYRCVFKTFE